MSRRKGAGGIDYTIGRGKPPEAGRFKKGQSGNPKGRPRKSGSEVVRPLEQAARDTFPA
jgi:hypothetical protein